MNFQYDEELEPVEDELMRPRREFTKPKSAGSSRAIQLRLAMMVAMLFLVIYLMYEAGNPERWKWLGLDNVPASSAIGAGSAEPDPSEANTSATEPAANIRLRGMQPIDGGGQAAPGAQLDASAVLAGKIGSANTLPRGALRFWQLEYRSLNSDERALLFELLGSLERGESLDRPQRESAGELVEQLDLSQSRFEQDLFEEITMATTGSENRNALFNDLQESKELWEESFRPAFNSVLGGEEITLGQQQAIRRLRRALDPYILGEVKDRTSIGWKGDTLAWRRLWELTQPGFFGDSPTEEARSTTRIELLSQPEVYRGRLVRVSGWARSARKQPFTDSPLSDVDDYYEIWMRPEESKLGPTCVYIAELPDSFPKIGEQYRELNERFEATGYFFKVRRYQAADQSVELAPVLIATELRPLAVSENLLTSKWQPSRTLLATLLSLIPVVAIALAWLAFRSSQSRRRQPGLKTRNSIAHTLDRLADDPAVESEREKVAGLYSLIDDDDTQERLP